MTTAEKRQLLEAIIACVRGDLLTDEECEQIMQILFKAIDRVTSGGE